MVFDSFSDNESHQQLPIGHATKGLWLVIWPCDRDEKCLPRSWNLQEVSCLVTSIPSTPRDKPKPVIMFRSQHACVWGSAATRTRRRIWPGGQVGPDRQKFSGLFWRPVSTTTWTLLSFLWWLGVPFFVHQDILFNNTFETTFKNMVRHRKAVTWFTLFKSEKSNEWRLIAIGSKHFINQAKKITPKYGQGSWMDLQLWNREPAQSGQRVAC